MDFTKIKKRVLISLIIGAAVILALGIYSDFNGLLGSFLKFDIRYLPVILVMAPCNYFFRFLKWNFYLKLLKIKLDRKDNASIFIAGLSMTVTPGKVGEFLKAFLIKEVNGTPVSVTSPLIVIERLTDGISMVILAGIGALEFKYGAGILLASAVGIAAFIAFVRYRTFALWLTGVLKKLPLLKKAGKGIDDFYNSSYQLLNVRSVLVSVGIGLVSWTFEGIVIYLVLLAFGMPVSVLTSIFIIAFSSVVGALSMLPGGVLVTEGSILGLLLMAGVDKEIASATTIITRFSTLWLGVFVGIAGLIAVQKRLEQMAQSRV